MKNVQKKSSEKPKPKTVVDKAVKEVPVEKTDAAKKSSDKESSEVVAKIASKFKGDRPALDVSFTQKESQNPGCEPASPKLLLFTIAFL